MEWCQSVPHHQGSHQEDGTRNLEARETDAAVYACATSLWKGVSRGGEFLVPSGSTFDPKYHVTKGTLTRGTLTRWARLASGIEWLKIFTHELGADIILTACDDITNPLPPLRHHL